MKRIHIIGLSALLILASPGACRKETKLDRYLRLLRKNLIETVKQRQLVQDEFDGSEPGREQRLIEVRLRSLERREAQIRTKIDQINRVISAKKGTKFLKSSNISVLMNEDRVRKKDIEKYRQEQIDRAWRHANINPKEYKGTDEENKD